MKTLKELTAADYLDYELEDDETDFGGTAFDVETVKDYILELEVEPSISIEELNKHLKNSGIKPIK